VSPISSFWETTKAILNPLFSIGGLNDTAYWYRKHPWRCRSISKKLDSNSTDCPLEPVIEMQHSRNRIANNIMQLQNCLPWNCFL
jgi:hypothetical protein